MKSEGLTSSRLAEILEIQPSGISHIVSGRNKPGFDLLQKILRRFPRINPDWLLLDSPTIYRDDEESKGQGDQFGDSSSDSSSIDLFGFGEVMGGFSVGEDSQNFAGENAAQNSNFLPPKNGSKIGLNSSPNSPQNLPSNSPQNQLQNRVQNHPSSATSVECIIVLYTDGTFRSYNMR